MLIGHHVKRGLILQHPVTLAGDQYVHAGTAPLSQSLMNSKETRVED